MDNIPFVDHLPTENGDFPAVVISQKDSEKKNKREIHKNQVGDMVVYSG